MKKGFTTNHTPMNDFLVCIQMRYSSKRLPGKALLPFDRKTLMEVMLERLSKLPYNIVVLTSQNKESSIIHEKCKEMNVKVIRGSEEDVLSRFANAAINFRPKYIIRCTGDNVFTSLALIKELIKYKTQFENNDLVTFEKITLPEGLKAELFPAQEIININNSKTKTDRDIEHVTDYFYRTGRVDNIQFEDTRICTAEFWSEVCKKTFTVDTQDEYIALRNFINSLSENQRAKLINAEIEVEEILLEEIALNRINMLCKRKDIE